MDCFQHALSLIASITTALPQPEATGLAAKSQDELDRATKQVADVADGVRRFKVVDVDPGVSQFIVQHAALNGNEPLDVYVDVVQSAQQGALFLNLGGEQLDLGGPTSALVLRIGGNGAWRELTFSSGTSMTTIAWVIRNYLPRQMNALDTNSGVVLQTHSLSDQAFVSVRVINTGGLEYTAPTPGIFRMLPDDANTFDPTQYTPIASPSAWAGVTDQGQDILGRVWATSPTTLITGPIGGQASWLRINRPRLRAAIELKPGPLQPAMGGGSQHLGTFKAFTIQRWP